MPREPRTKPRKLVRWDDEIDVMLLLAIPRVLARRGIKFPWGEVAAYVAPGVTGNALLQHLAKLSKKRKDTGLLVPEDREHQVGEMRDYALIASAGFGDRRIGHDKKQRRQATASDDDDEDLAVAPKRVLKTISKAKRGAVKTTKTQARRARSASVKQEYDSDDDFSDVPQQKKTRASKPRQASKRVRNTIEDDEDWQYPSENAVFESQSRNKKIKIEHNVVHELPPTPESSNSKQKGKVLTLSFNFKQQALFDKAGQWQDEQNADNNHGSGNVDSFMEIPGLNLEQLSPTGSDGNQQSYGLGFSAPTHQDYDLGYALEHRIQPHEYENIFGDDYLNTNQGLTNFEFPDTQVAQSSYVPSGSADDRSQFTIFEDAPIEGHNAYNDLMNSDSILDDKGF